MFTVDEIAALPMPDGYRRSIHAWFAARSEPGREAKRLSAVATTTSAFVSAGCACPATLIPAPSHGHRVADTTTTGRLCRAAARR